MGLYYIHFTYKIKHVYENASIDVGVGVTASYVMWQHAMCCNKKPVLLLLPSPNRTEKRIDTIVTHCVFGCGLVFSFLTIFLPLSTVVTRLKWGLRLRIKYKYWWKYGVFRGFKGFRGGIFLDFKSVSPLRCDTYTKWNADHLVESIKWWHSARDLERDWSTNLIPATPCRTFQSIISVSEAASGAENSSLHRNQNGAKVKKLRLTIYKGVQKGANLKLLETYVLL